MSNKIIPILIIIGILLVSGVAGWSWYQTGGGKNKQVFIVLDSGKTLEVTNINFNQQERVITATVIAPKLSIQEVVEVNNITKEIQDQLDNKKNSYDLNVVVIQNE